MAWQRARRRGRGVARWLRYGQVAPGDGGGADPLLDRFMPAYDVVERHQVRVTAPAAITFASASEMDLFQSLPIRAIVRGREWIMGSTPDATTRPQAFLALVTSIGWGVLAERPGEELVMGAVTQPWLADVVFRPLPPDEFAAFNQPGYVKIAWTLRADPVGDAGSGVPHRDASRPHRSDRPREVPPVLVVRLAWNHPHSTTAAGPAESRGRAPGTPLALVINGFANVPGFRQPGPGDPRCAVEHTAKRAI